MAVEGSRLSATDINDRRQQGNLPDDPAKEAKPVTPKAKQQAEDEARLATERQVMLAGIDHILHPPPERKILTTTHWEIDRDTEGFVPEQVWFIGGLSGFGKTSLTIACSDEQIQDGHRPLIVSGEDPIRLYGRRFMLRRTRADRYRFAEGKLSESEYRDVVAEAQKASNQPLYLDAIGMSVEKAAKRVKSIVAAEGVNMVYWDYVQCFNKDKASDGRRMDITYISRVMIDCIKMLGISGAVLSQITPDEKTLIPKKEMLRDSKDMGNSAEVVAIGFQAKTALERDRDGRRVQLAAEGDRCLVLDKNKPGPGPAGRVYRMGSDPKHECFDVVKDPNAHYDEMADIAVSDMPMPDFDDRYP